MADGAGLSVGATNLAAAVVVGRIALTRSPVLTLYPHRPPEVGVPSQNPNLNEPGLIITDFVDRVETPWASWRPTARRTALKYCLPMRCGLCSPPSPVASHPPSPSA